MEDIIDSRRLTPMLRQYVEAKEAHKDALLFFRMGDFYELFFDDAKLVARELDLTLTARDKSDNPIPMAGVPHHAVAQYINKLIEKGYTVAICDQVEDPRTAKGLVKREITQLITPGTVADLEALDPTSQNYLAYALKTENAWVVALLDMLAGEILCTRCSFEALGDELVRMGVRELLVHDKAEIGTLRLSVRAVGVYREKEAETFLKERFGHALIEDLVAPYEDEQDAIMQLIHFADSTQRRQIPHLMPPRAYRLQEFLMLDETTRRNLELTETQLESKRYGSLLWHLDHCQTSLGSRTLRQWLLFPLNDQQKIAERLTHVENLKDNRTLREHLNKALDGVRDVERLLGKVALKRATPRDLGALHASLSQLPLVQQLFNEEQTLLAQQWQTLDIALDLQACLEKALEENLPLSAQEGGIFKKGYNEKLDELLVLSREGHHFLLDLEKREKERTGINNLKVRYNRVFGYYIEITKANLAQVPKDFIRKQTLVNAERFITEELKIFEEKVLHADELKNVLELELFEKLLLMIADNAKRLRKIARLIGQTDALASLAEVADRYRYCKPTLLSETKIELVASRHPTIERLLPNGERFVPNDVRLNADQQLMLITGPNMAGKSTVMRQVALCCLLTHMGSFVPAESAALGLCDRIFTRVGAADNLGRGYSTFMVEMIETATILQHATPQSLVLFDEVGRGTSTYDGVSIARAIAEFLHDEIHCLTMFATHYHELTDLPQSRPHIFNTHVAVKEIQNNEQKSIVFLRHLSEGPANRSYGIQVARLALLPEKVLLRAEAILGNLEKGGNPKFASKKQVALAKNQLALFDA